MRTENCIWIWQCGGCWCLCQEGIPWSGEDVSLIGLESEYGREGTIDSNYGQFLQGVFL